MSNDENILLCDIGGTHARFARFVKKGKYDHFKKYRLKEFKSFDHIIEAYIQDTGLMFTEARFAAAKTPVNGVISYKRSEHDPDFDINFPHLQRHFNWPMLLHLDDMEPAILGATWLNEHQPEKLKTVIPSKEKPWNNNTLLISVGTGLGFAHDLNWQAYATPGGHVLPLTVTNEHRQVEAFARARKDHKLSLVMEDFVSLGGLKMIHSYMTGDEGHDLSPEEFMAGLQSQPDVTRLFFEFLGLYAHMVTCCTAFYGGIFLTGGVLDHLIAAKLTDWKAFEKYFRAPMLPVVNARLESTAVHYILHDEVPLLGLTTL